MTGLPQWYPLAAIGTLALTGLLVLSAKKANNILESNRGSSVNYPLSSHTKSFPDIELQQPVPSQQRLNASLPSQSASSLNKPLSRRSDIHLEPKIANSKPASPSPQTLFVPKGANLGETDVGIVPGANLERSPPSVSDRDRYNRRPRSPPRPTYHNSAATFLERRSLPSAVNVRDQELRPANWRRPTSHLGRS